MWRAGFRQKIPQSENELQCQLNVGDWHDRLQLRHGRKNLSGLAVIAEGNFACRPISSQLPDTDDGGSAIDIQERATRTELLRQIVLGGHGIALFKPRR